MRPFLVYSAVALIIGISACGGASKGKSSASSGFSGTRTDGSKPTGSQPKDSNDHDGDASSDDDLQVMEYGHAASAADVRAITAAVMHYYTVAAAEDGVKACSMLVAIVAEAVPEEFSQAPGKAHRRDKTCAAVISAFFKREHQHIAAELASLEVTRVRTEEGKGLAMLRFATTPEPRKISLRYEHDAWKIRELLDSGTP